ncbi:hypothetical protein HanIR_Chr17g0882921 [Helianthus annuus]|nr:hypothetical protein HanIR_Chr17g0882921 [Helianthus annuus]
MSSASEEGSSSDEDHEVEEVKKEIWKGHYSSAHKILLVGEGDFSFSLCLARSFGSARNIVATTVDTHRKYPSHHLTTIPLLTYCCFVTEQLVKKYSNVAENVRELQDRGSVVLYGVDATAMSNHFFITTQRFHRIVYNFPHVGFRFPEANGCQIK